MGSDGTGFDSGRRTEHERRAGAHWTHCSSEPAPLRVGCRTRARHPQGCGGWLARPPVAHAARRTRALTPRGHGVTGHGLATRRASRRGAVVLGSRGEPSPCARDAPSRLRARGRARDLRPGGCAPAPPRADSPHGPSPGPPPAARPGGAGGVAAPCRLTPVTGARAGLRAGCGCGVGGRY